MTDSIQAALSSDLCLPQSNWRTRFAGDSQSVHVARCSTKEKGAGMIYGPSLLTAFAVVLLVDCGHPRRPPNVPAASTFVEGAKTGWWQHCESSGAAIHCAIWNKVGDVLLDEEFLPLDGGAIPSRDSMALRSGGPCTGVYQVCLSNGRILLPRSRFHELKDFIEGKRP